MYFRSAEKFNCMSFETLQLIIIHCFVTNQNVYHKMKAMKIMNSIYNCPCISTIDACETVSFQL